MKTSMQKTYQFKLDGAVQVVSIQHSADVENVVIALNGSAVAHRRSRINPRDFTFSIGSHFCIAQVYPAGSDFVYDLVVDGSSLEARRQKRMAATTGAAAAPAPKRAVDPSILAVAEKPSAETIRAMSEAETMIPRRKDREAVEDAPTASMRRAIELALIEERRKTINDRYELPHSLRIQEEEQDQTMADYWRTGHLYEDRKAPWENDTESASQRRASLINKLLGRA